MVKPLKIESWCYVNHIVQFSDFHVCLKSRHYNIRIVFTLHKDVTKIVGEHYCEEFKTNVEYWWMNCSNIKSFLNIITHAKHWFSTDVSRKD